MKHQIALEKKSEALKPSVHFLGLLDPPLNYLIDGNTAASPTAGVYLVFFMLSLVIEGCVPKEPGSYFSRQVGETLLFMRRVAVLQVGKEGYMTPFD